MADTDLTSIIMDGTSYDVVHIFNSDRVVINYLGLFAIADQGPLERMVV